MGQGPANTAIRAAGRMRVVPPDWAVFGAVLAIAFYLLVSQNDALYSWPYSSGLLAISSLYLYRKTQTAGFLRCFPYVALIYLTAIAGYLFSRKYPVHDSFHYHFPAFQYFAESIAAGKGFPEWFASSGGVRVGFSHINLGYVLPYHLAGYALYALTPLTTLAAYKLSYAIGVLLIGLGWGLFLERLTKSALAAVVGSLAVMLGGSCITFHQEQALYTLTWLPWLLLALYEIKHDRRWLLVVAALSGLLAVTHYPQIHFIAITILLAVVVVARPDTVRERLFLPGWKLSSLAILLFLAGVSPLIYITGHLDELTSLERPFLAGGEYFEWLLLNGWPDGNASAPPWYFKQYIALSESEAFSPELLDNPYSDKLGFYAGKVTLGLALIALAFQLPKAWPVIVLTAIYALFTMGIRSPVDLASASYHVAEPLMRSMREWMHFYPLVNLGLASLAGIGIAHLAARMEMTGTGRRSVIASTLVILFALFVFELSDYAWRYIKWYTNPGVVVDAFERFPRYGHHPSLLQYRNRMWLNELQQKGCLKGVIPAAPVLTTNVKSHAGAGDEQIAALLNGKGLTGGAVVANIPESILPSIGSPAYRGENDHVDQQLHYDGADFRVTNRVRALLVTSVNYDLGLDVSVDGKPEPVWRVNGALAGVLLEPGRHTVELRLRNDGYTYALQAHLAIIVATVVLIMFLFARRRRAALVK